MPWLVATFADALRLLDSGPVKSALALASLALIACDSSTGIVLTLEYDPVVGRAEVTGNAGTEEIIPKQIAEDLPADENQVDLVFILDEGLAGRTITLDVVGFSRMDGSRLLSDS